jgi:hypothetical protein
VHRKTFQRFSLTPQLSEVVSPPGIAECFANLECRLVDDSMVPTWSLRPGSSGRLMRGERQHGPNPASSGVGAVHGCRPAHPPDISDAMRRPWKMKNPSGRLTPITWVFEQRVGFILRTTPSSDR